MWYKTDPDKYTQDNTIPTYPRKSKMKPKTEKDLRKTVTTITIPRTHDGALARAISRTEMDLRLVCKTKSKWWKGWGSPSNHS